MDIIITILMILVVSRLLSGLFARIKQPPVIGELIAGIILGPSILSIISPDTNGLDALAELGVLFLVLFAGMQMHLTSMREYFHPAFFIAFMGNNLAMLSGVLLGKLYDLGIITSLFIGVVFSLTALPVGVRILMDLGKMDTPTGKIIMTSAVIDDIFSIFLFVMVLFIAESGSRLPEAGFVSAAIIKILIFLLLVYLFNEFLTIKGGLPARYITLAVGKLTRESQFFYILLFGILIGNLGGLLGITIIIGIFYAGILIKGTTIGEEAYSNVYNVISSITFGIFSPIFFAYMGLLMDATVIFDYSDPFSGKNIYQLTFFLSSLVFATVGKSGGAFVGGLLANMKFKDAAAAGIGLNARGLMGLVILEIGLKHRLIEQSVYALLLAMCIITTFVTPYLLKKILK